MLLLTACGAYKAKLKTAVTETPIAARAAPGVCEAFPFDHTFTYAEVTNGQGKELGEGLKVCDFKWRIGVTVDALTGDEGHCADPVGAVVLSAFVLEYTNDDGSPQQTNVDCGPFARATDTIVDLEKVANACLESLASNQLDAVKKAFSTKTKKLRIYASAACGVDACFSGSFTLKTIVDDGTIVLGVCPANQ